MSKRLDIKPGDIYSDLKVLECLGSREYNNGKKAIFYKCECLKCGNIVDILGYNLGKRKNNCGCWRSEPKKIIPTGTVFSHLTVIGLGKHVKGRGYYYLCECDCDKHTQIEVRSDLLKSGDITSCGCVHDALFQARSTEIRSKCFVEDTLVSKIAYDRLQSNNTSGYRGVNWHKGSQKWHAVIAFKGTTYSLGYYTDINDAAKARKLAEEELYKDFFAWYSEQYPEQWKKILQRREAPE